MRPTLGLFDQKLFEQFGHRVVDEFAAVVGVKSENHERELFQNLFQHRHQPSLRDLGHSGYNLPLRHLVDGIDVIQPLGAVAIALVYGVDSEESGASSRPRLAPLAYRNRRGACRLIAGIAFSVGFGVAYAVDLRNRDPGDPMERCLIVLGILPLQNVLCGRAA